MRLVSAPVKHHFVPQFLLREFGDEDQGLTVHRLLGSTYNSSVRDVGHRNHGHTLVRRDGSTDQSGYEAIMSEIEAAAAASLGALVDGEPLDEERRSALRWFLALQWRRHRYLFNAIHSEIETPSDLSKAEIQSGLLRVSLMPLFSAWRLRNDTSAYYKDRWDYVESTLSSYKWRLVRYRSDVLVIGDTTLCSWGTRPPNEPGYNAALARHGLGVPLHAAARLTVPLTPRLGLLMTHDEKTQRLDAKTFNRATVYNSREFVAHARGWTPTNPEVGASLMRDLEVQRWLAPMLIKGPL